MQIGTKVSFHNRFDIEVYDSSTGRLKQKGSAENIVLDRMYTRLCNLYSYFTRIVFGSGTGDLSPSRTTLFNREGARSATTEETIKGFPVSKWTRSITLMPEEFVGVELTEVGISEDSTNINTHALIKDAEGNQLSIVKTDTDVVIIYATVFIELQDSGEDIYWCNLPNDNRVLNYLLGGSAPSGSVILGRKWTKGDTISSNIIQSKTGSYTPDISNRKVKLNTLRFGIDEGNDHIAEIEIFDSFKTTLPNTEVFQDYILKDINIGVGDGNTREFTLPHIRADNIVVKTNNSINTGINIKSYIYAGFKDGDLTGVGTDGRGVAMSQDGETIVTASYISPYFTVHRLNADGQYEKVQNLTGVGNGGYGAVVSQDGETIVAASYYSPYFTVHRLNADGQYEKVQDLTDTGSTGTGVAISQDGETIVTASDSNPYFTVHKLTADGQYEKVQNLTGVGSGGYGVAISQDGETIVTASRNDSPYFTVHRLNADGQYEKVQDLTGVGVDGYGVAISQDGETIVTASYYSPYFTVHRLNADGQYEKVQDLTGVGGNSRGVLISQDGETIVTASYLTPNFTVHKLGVDGQYEKVQDLTGVGDRGFGVAMSQDGETIVTASDYSPYFTVHHAEKVLKTIVFDTPPAEGTIITADYSVPYIPKSEDYVLDVSAEVQFGEGAIV